MFVNIRCFICKCVKLPPYGNFTIGTNYSFEYLIDAEKIIDDFQNKITTSENIFKKCFDNIDEVVTSYSPVLNDCTDYKIYLVLHEKKPSIEEIRVYAKIMNKNYLQAKKELKFKKNLLVSGNAYDIGDILRILYTFQVEYEIEPPYPYTLPIFS